MKQNYDQREKCSLGLSSDQLFRQSMDRFDDSLVENILSYLTFSEKVLFESVSKQWKKCIYKQQKELLLNTWDDLNLRSLNRILEPIEVVDFTTSTAVSQEMKAINKSSLISILKKCHSIQSVDFDCFVDFEDLDIIGRYCPKLKSLVFEVMGLSANDLDLFGRRYGDRLEQVDYYYSTFVPKYFNSLLIHCKNLREFRSSKFSEFFCGDEEYLPSLQSINFFNWDQKEHGDIDYMSKFEMLCNKYSESLKKLRIFNRWQMNGNQLNQFLTNVCKLKNLIDLSFSVRVDNGHKVAIYDYLKTIATNNPNLSKIGLTLNKNFLVQDQMWNVFGLFNNLVEFDIYIKNSNLWRKVFSGGISSFKNTKLRVLRIAYKQINEEFFADIDKHLPDLSKLSIVCESEISDKTVFQLSNLKKLREFQLNKSNKCNKRITDESICAVIRGCPALQNMYFAARPNITHKTIETLIECMSNNPKRSLSFECGLSHKKGEVNFEIIDLNAFAQRMPRNLSISIQQIDLQENQ